MVAFYDRIVLSALKDVLRKVGGGKVDSVGLVLDERGNPRGGWHITPPTQTTSGKWMVKSSDYNSKGLLFDTESEARAALAEKQGVTEQPSFTITPAMREKAAGGLPLFKVDEVDSAATKADTSTYAQDPNPQHQNLARQWQSEIAEGNPSFVLHAVTPPGSETRFRSVAAAARGVAGHKVIYVKQPNGRVFNGSVSTGKNATYVLIDVDSNVPVMAVLGHEILHRLKTQNPSLYDKVNASL